MQWFLKSIRRWLPQALLRESSSGIAWGKSLKHCLWRVSQALLWMSPTSVSRESTSSVFFEKHVRHLMFKHDYFCLGNVQTLWTRYYLWQRLSYFLTVGTHICKGNDGLREANFSSTLSPCFLYPSKAIFSPRFLYPPKANFLLVLQFQPHLPFFIFPSESIEFLLFSRPLFFSECNLLGI